jgi:hypothetical protein
VILMRAERDEEEAEESEWREQGCSDDESTPPDRSRPRLRRSRQVRLLRKIARNFSEEDGSVQPSGTKRRESRSTSQSWTKRRLARRRRSPREAAVRIPGLSHLGLPKPPNLGNTGEPGVSRLEKATICVPEAPGVIQVMVPGLASADHSLRVTLLAEQARSTFAAC